MRVNKFFLLIFLLFCTVVRAGTFASRNYRHIEQPTQVSILHSTTKALNESSSDLDHSVIHGNISMSKVCVDFDNYFSMKMNLVNPRHLWQNECRSFNFSQPPFRPPSELA